MRTALIKLEGCKVGQKVAEDVYNRHNGMLVPKDYILTERILNVIRGNEIAALKVYLDEDETSDFEIVDVPHQEHAGVLQKTVEDYKRTRSSDILKVEETFFDVSKGKPVSKGTMDTLSNNIIETFDSSLIPYIGSIKVSDNYMLEHSLNMGTLASLFARWLKFDEVKTNNFIQSALLHDIGRVKINPKIFSKPGKLTSEEFDQVKQHSIFSYRLVQESGDLDNDIKMGILMHHERCDGSGYPLGAKGVQIHEFGKLLAIIDIYDAMTTDRIFQSKTFSLKVLDELYQHSFEKLDYGYVNTFTKNMLNYYSGCSVRLNTGEIGSLIHIDQKNITRPIIKIDNALVNLLEESDLEIEAIV